MSAYVCHHDTINLIASAASRLNITAHVDGMVRAPSKTTLVGVTDAFAIGRLLYDENVFSVSARYEEDDVDDAGPFVPRAIDIDWLCGGPSLPWEVIVLASIRCLRYQSCEASDYHESAAAHVLNDIESAIIRRITADAPWGWKQAWSDERAKTTDQEDN